MTSSPQFALMAVLSFTFGHSANAEDKKLEFSANVALTPDYSFRGITQTDSGPAIQGGFDAAHGVFYAGTWASSVDFGDDTTMEIDFYGGVAPSIGNSDFDFRANYYVYPDPPELPTGSQNFIKSYAGAGRALGGCRKSIGSSPSFGVTPTNHFSLTGRTAREVTRAAANALELYKGESS